MSTFEQMKQQFPNAGVIIRSEFYVDRYRAALDVWATDTGAGPWVGTMSRARRNLAQALNGQICPRCSGHGVVLGRSGTCQRCEGYGFTAVNPTLAPAPAPVVDRSMKIIEERFGTLQLRIATIPEALGTCESKVSECTRTVALVIQDSADPSWSRPVCVVCARQAGWLS